jgi:hypothetical protein
MPLALITTHPSRRFGIRRAALRAALALLSVSCCGIALARAQTEPVTIAKLSGDDVSVKGAVSFDVENGRSTALLASGSDVTVRAGEARIELTDGGEITVCGPAHFTLLKSGEATTMALDYGTVHSQLDSTVPLTVFTPQVVATPVAIGQGQRDITLGLDPDGTLCTLATQGAMRLTQQFSGQSLLVPQGGTMNLVGGQLSTLTSSPKACTCRPPALQSAPPVPLELSVPIHPAANPPAMPAPKPPVLSDEPIYQVYMPPLTFDSASPAPPPPPDPQTILLVREARLQPAVVFHGRVEAAPTPAPAPPPPRATVEGDRAKPKRPGIFHRLFHFLFHHGHPECVGAGCGGE